jgi:hypothetical protein
MTEIDPGISPQSSRPARFRTVQMQRVWRQEGNGQSARRDELHGETVCFHGKQLAPLPGKLTFLRLELFLLRLELSPLRLELTPLRLELSFLRLELSFLRLELSFLRLELSTLNEGVSKGQFAVESL